MASSNLRKLTHKAALIFALSVLCLWTWAELSNAAPEGAKPAPDALANPIEQRREMIELLRSIDRRLGAIEERLAANGTTAR